MSLTFVCIPFSLLQKSSSLFSILPAPTNSSVKGTKRSLIPHVLTKKSPSIASASVSKSQSDDSVKNAYLISYADSEEESDGEGDFFSLNKDHKVEAINNTDTTKPVTPLVADSGFDTDDSVSANKGDTLKSNDESLTFSSKFNPSPSAKDRSEDGHEVYGHWQNDMEPTTETASCSIDGNISVQQEELQLNDEAVSCITIEMFNLNVS
jgi:hypothetical protein